jgi:hypothetical protein
MLVFVHGEEVTGAMDQVPRWGHIGQQDEAARLVLQAGNTLSVGAKDRLQALAHGFDGARLVGTRPAPALHGPFFNRDLHPMVGRVDSAELRCRGFRIGAAKIHVLLSGPGRTLDRTIGGLDVPDQPLLPPLVLGAGVDDHGAIRRPVERDLALRGFIGSDRTVCGWLRVGQDTDLFPGIVGHCLGNEPPTCALRGWEAADEQGIAQCGQMVLGHQRRIGHVDIGAWRHPMLGQEGRNVRQEGVVDGFIRGIALL